jgi:hypothetical protein
MAMFPAIFQREFWWEPLSSNQAVVGFFRALGYDVEDRISMEKQTSLDLKEPS